MQTLSSKTTLHFLFHPQICVPRSSSPARDSSKYIQTFYLDFINHICMGLQQKNKGHYILQTLLAPKIIEEDGWQIISEQKFHEYSKLDLICQPIPFFSKDKASLKGITNSVEFSILFNQDEFCRAFIGFISPEIPVLQVIFLLASFFKIPIADNFSVMQYSDQTKSKCSLANIRGLYPGDFGCDFVIVEEEAEMPKFGSQKQVSQCMSLVVQNNNSDPFMMDNSQVIDLNASTGIGCLYFNQSQSPEPDYKSRLWSEKKESQIALMREMSRVSMNGPLLYVPNLSEEMIMENMEQEVRQIEQNNMI